MRIRLANKTLDRTRKRAAHFGRYKKTIKIYE